jgi:peptidoglycan/LPS O-acetylase OafA/YrhL
MVWFANQTLAGHPTMMTGWVPYTQPVAFFGYFASGCLIGEAFVRFGAQIKGHPAAIAVAALALVPFFVVQSEHPTGLLTGANGIALMTGTIVFVAAVAFMIEPRGKLRVIAEWFGKLSYPVYLLHGLVYYLILVSGVGGSTFRICAAAVLTIALSFLTNRYVEEPARNLGRKNTPHRIETGSEATRKGYP